MELTLFVEVIIPVPIPGSFTYRVSRDLKESIAVGKRVVVQFGKRKLYTGLVIEVHEQPPKSYEAKYVLSILDEQAVVLSNQIKFWRWMASYYMCTLGEVFKAALPSGLQLSSETKVTLNQSYGDKQLTDKEFLIVEALELQSELSMDDISKILDQKSVYPVVNGLIAKEVVLTYEALKQRYKPKKMLHYFLHENFKEEHKLKDIFNELTKAPKQLKALQVFLDLSGYFHKKSDPVQAKIISAKAGVSSSIIGQLVKKGILVKANLVESRLSRDAEQGSAIKLLSIHQTQALEEIKGAFENNKVALLHGITSSGKTELYVHLIKASIEKGQQVLFLLPEIAITTHLIGRLKHYFKDQVAVYHSKFNQNERVEVWQENLNTNSSFKIFIGARSSIFLPFHNLGLIIVDEEHENSFKQYEPSPRYQTRDAAIVLAQQYNANILLGTATPSLESVFNAEQDKYRLIELNKRHGNVPLPEIWVADLKKERKQQSMKGIFSSLLIDEIRKALKFNKQIILFKNRRGYSPFLQCETCGWSAQCSRCDITLTYHKHSNTLKCHYCGLENKPMSRCGQCGSQQVRTKGFGTERIEEELQILFPKTSIKRMDLDTTKNKSSYHDLLSQFEQHQIDILVGTQMVAKGLDFHNVGLVGVLDADGMLSYPDFRAHENAFQLMVQVAGRAGRFKERGKVIIQSSNPYHFIIQKVIENDFKGFSEVLLSERKRYSYPPYSRLIKITCRHKNYEEVERFSKILGSALKMHFGNFVLGPESPTVGRVRNNYLKQIFVKLSKEQSLKQQKDLIFNIKEELMSKNKFPPFGVILDVDPY